MITVHVVVGRAENCDAYIIGERERANLVVRLARLFCLFIYIYIYMFAAGVTFS